MRFSCSPVRIRRRFLPTRHRRRPSPTFAPACGNAPWPRQVDPAPTAHLPANTHTTQPASARHGDPIADLIGSYVGSTARVTAVQRILSQYGYGQIKPSGVIDGPTSAAIEKFERDHQMPVTGRLSDRLLTELAAMIGHPLDVE